MVNLIGSIANANPGYDPADSVPRGALIPTPTFNATIGLIEGGGHLLLELRPVEDLPEVLPDGLGILLRCDQKGKEAAERGHGLTFAGCRLASQRFKRA